MDQLESSFRIERYIGCREEQDFWNRVGRRYPVAYGWEAWLVFKALQLGHQVDCLLGLGYVHARARGSAQGFRFWGKPCGRWAITLSWLWPGS